MMAAFSHFIRVVTLGATWAPRAPMDWNCMTDRVPVGVRANRTGLVIMTYESIAERRHYL